MQNISYPRYALGPAILGKDLLSSGEIASALGLSYTEDQLIELATTMPDQEALLGLRNNDMFLVPSPPIAMNVLDIQKLKPELFYSKGLDKGGSRWHNKQPFARTDMIPALGWIAFRKRPIEHSFDKTWLEQQALLVEPMSIPNAAEMIWGLVTYKIVRDLTLFDDLYVRTSSVGSDGQRVNIGFFNDDGLYIDDGWDNGRDPPLGISACRKFYTPHP